jgi:PAS domain S-box-containing protein
MGRRIRELDWSRTRLGPLESWPQSLRAHVGMIVDNSFAMYIFWGPDNVAIYNDAYRAIAGDKHPTMLGMLTEDVWHEVWPVIDPLVRQVKSGEAVTLDDLLLRLERYDFSEDAFFTFSYSPLRSEGGVIAGVLATVVETTANVLAQRRIELLRELAMRTNTPQGESESLSALRDALSDSADVPFSLIYLAPEGTRRATLAVTCGKVPSGFAPPPSFALDAFAGTRDENDTIIVPIASPNHQHPVGALVAGTNPHLKLDDTYRRFMALLAAQIGTTIAAARAYDVGRLRAESLQITQTIQKIGLLTDSSQQLFWMAQPDGFVDWYNQSWYDYTGQTIEEARGWGSASVLHPNDADGVMAQWRASLASGTPLEMTFRMRGRDGRYRWFRTRAVPELNEQARPVRWYGTNTDVDAERRAIRQLDVLAGLGDRLVQALDQEHALLALVEGLVPELADWTMINLADPFGDLILSAARHADHDKSVLLESFVGRSYEIAGGRSGAVRVFSSGRPEVMESTSPEAVHANVIPAFRDVITRVGLTSTIIVPIVSNGKTIGSFHALSSGEDKQYVEGDIPFYMEIGRRIGFALRNADAYERELRIAHAFQNAALPSVMPQVSGLHFASLYEPSSSEANVGGDFYDAFRLLDGRVVVSIGDVSGSGLGAAATMAALRQSIRAAAHINPDPDLLLKAADGVFADPGRAPFASAFVAIIDPLTFSMQYANAGHPAPILRAPDGTLTMLASNDLLLGVQLADRHVVRTIGKAAIDAGTLLVLYTDGLTEASHDFAAGERLLADSVTALDVTAETAGHFARALHDAVLGVGPASRDDVAVLTALFEEPMITSSPAIFAWRFASNDEVAAHGARNAMVRELERCGFAADDISTAEVIFSELVGNVLRHAGDEAHVVLDISQDAPVLHVMDRGPGFSLNPKLPVDFYSERGRGLFIVTQLAREYISNPRTLSVGSHARAVLHGRVRSRPS